MSGNNREEIIVRKASGEKEPFSSEKLKQSLKNAGAEQDIIKSILEDILSWLYDGVTTKKIYNRAFRLLRSSKIKSAAKYKLKKAHKLELLNDGIVICRQIRNDPKTLDILDLKEKQKEQVLAEVNNLCQ